MQSLRQERSKQTKIAKIKAKIINKRKLFKNPIITMPDEDKN